MDKEEKEQVKDRKKRRKFFRAKRLDPDIAKVEFRDKIKGCGAPFVIVGKVGDEFSNSEGYMKLWVDMSPALVGGPKVIRSEVKGHIIQVYQERIAREMVRLMQQGPFRHSLSEYLDYVTAMPLNFKNNVKITIKRE